MNNLDALRTQLQSLNNSLFELMDTRRLIVHSIQDEKKSSNQNVFLPEREIELFFSMKNEIQKLSFKKLLAFSLIIEDDARSYNQSYPAWSEKVHVALSKNILEEQINPILLKAYDLKLFQSISFTQDFDFIRKL